MLRGRKFTHKTVKGICSSLTRNPPPPPILTRLAHESPLWTLFNCYPQGGKWSLFQHICSSCVFLTSLVRMVFDCRFCSEIPLGDWLGLTKMKSEVDPKNTRLPKIPRPSKRRVDEFDRRSPEAIDDLVSSWEPYVHPRAREFFPSQEMLLQVLKQIGRGLNKTEDPILGMIYLQLNKSLSLLAVRQLFRLGLLHSRAKLWHFYLIVLTSRLNQPWFG